MFISYLNRLWMRKVDVIKRFQTSRSAEAIKSSIKVDGIRWGILVAEQNHISDLFTKWRVCQYGEQVLYNVSWASSTCIFLIKKNNNLYPCYSCWNGKGPIVYQHCCSIRIKCNFPATFFVFLFMWLSKYN